MFKEKCFFEEKVFSRNHKFSFKEDVELINLILSFKRTGKILDLGCGEGGNSLKLAEKGFKVTCIDISRTAINALKKEAVKRKTKIKIVCQDIDDLELKECFDVIIITGVIHFLEKNIKSFIRKIKQKTNKEGFNILDVFLTDSKCQENSKGRYFSKGEIIKMYSDWKIIKHSIYKENQNKSEFAVFQK
ncbi:MAG: methyltransferase domain-containing protein [archaeon]